MLKQSVQHHRLILEMESIRKFLLAETDTHNGLAGEISRKDTLSKKPTWRMQLGGCNLEDEKLAKAEMLWIG